MRPVSETELAEMLRGAAGPLAVRGGGTRGIGRPVPGAVLQTGGLAGVRLYEPGALTLVAGAGTPMAEVEALLAAEGQRLPFEPMDHRPLLGGAGVPTLGGMVAANASGPRRVQAGACRDSLIGVRLVDGTGAVIKNGGRVMKNVTGYDLVKLMAGSWGTLGVLSEVSFKLLPRPETEATLVLQGLRATGAVAAMAAALGLPWEVSGAAFGAQDAEGRGAVHLRIEGFADSVRYRLGRIEQALAAHGQAERIEDAARSARLWRGIRDVEGFADRAFVARVSIKPSDLPALMADPALRQSGAECLADWGGGLVWVAAAPDAAGAEPDIQRGRGLIEALQGFAAARGGHATLVKAPLALRRLVPSFQPEAPAVAALSRGLRARFDPRGILNPGLME